MDHPAAALARIPPEMSDDARTAADVIAERAPGFSPRVGIVLGSGLGKLADAVERRGNGVPLAAESTYDLRELGAYPGNAGSSPGPERG